MSWLIEAKLRSLVQMRNEYYTVESEMKRQLKELPWYAFKNKRSHRMEIIEIHGVIKGIDYSITNIENRNIR